MDDGALDGDNVWRDGFVSSFTMILLAEIADKTFFIAAILGWVLTILVTDSGIILKPNFIGVSS